MNTQIGLYQKEYACTEAAAAGIHYKSLPRSLALMFFFDLPIFDPQISFQTVNKYRKRNKIFKSYQPISCNHEQSLIIMSISVNYPHILKQSVSRVSPNHHFLKAKVALSACRLRLLATNPASSERNKPKYVVPIFTLSSYSAPLPFWMKDG